MKCLNCGVEAGRKGNRHVKSRQFTCARTKRELQTKRNWFGRREENWVIVDDDSLDPYECGLTDWMSTDEKTYRPSYYDSRFDSYYADSYRVSSRDSEPDVSDFSREVPDYTPSPSRSDDYVAPSSSSDDSWSSGSSDSGSSWSSSPSSDSGSSWSSSSSSDSGSSSWSSGSSSSDSGSSSSDSW